MPNRSQVPYYCSCHNISCLFANHHRSVNQTRSHLDSNEIQKQLVHSSRKSSHRLLAFREAVTTESHTYIPNLISHQMLLSLHSVCFCFHNFFLRRLTWLTFLLHRSLDTEIMKIHVILATLALFLLGCIAESDGVMVKEPEADIRSLQRKPKSMKCPKWKAMELDCMYCVKKWMDKCKKVKTTCMGTKMKNKCRTFKKTKKKGGFRDWELIRCILRAERSRFLLVEKSSRIALFGTTITCCSQYLLCSSENKVLYLNHNLSTLLWNVNTPLTR